MCWHVKDLRLQRPEESADPRTRHRRHLAASEEKPRDRTAREQRATHHVNISLECVQLVSHVVPAALLGASAVRH